MTHRENIKAILECYFAGTKEEIIDSARNRILEQEPNREIEDYENEIEDLHNRLDIAKYDKERLREEVTNLEAKIEVLEQESIEVEATKLQMAYNQGFEDCRKAVMDLLNEAGKLSLLAMVADLQSGNPQEPKIGHWTHDGSHWKNRFICSKCGYKLFDEQTNFCPSCGCRMVEPQESEAKND